MDSFIKITASPAETEQIGYEVAVMAVSTGFIALYGELGAGKTAFVRGVSRLLAPGACVTSPTYSIVNEYSPENSSKPTLFHFDMYRITDEDSLDSIDFDSYFTRDAVIITEWSENIAFALPESYIKVEIEKLDSDRRKITVSKISDDNGKNI